MSRQNEETRQITINRNRDARIDTMKKVQELADARSERQQKGR